MTIIDIANEIGAKNKMNKKAKRSDSFDWRPVMAEEYSCPVFNTPKLTIPNRKKMSKVLAFIDLTKPKRYAEGCTIMPIPTTSKRLISICGNQREVSRLISFMINIGLLEIESNEYQYNSDQEEYNKSKTYRYYFDNEKIIEEYCIKNDINKYIVRNYIYNPVVDKIFIDSFDNSQVRFSSKLHLLKPDNYSIAQFEDYLTDVLYDNYPLLNHYQKLADEINDKYYANYPEMSLMFSPTFTWSKGNKAVRKIGIRCTNSLVSAKKAKDDDEDFHGYYKEDILRKYGLTLEKDAKSSVPRVTLSLNTGEWVDEDIDIYRLIYDEYIKYHHNDPVVDKFSDARESIKTLHMRSYFDDDKMLGVHTRRAMANVIDKAEVDREMRLYKEAVTQAEGGYLYDNEIFFHESCIYMDVLNVLLQNGFFVWQCYDAFYAKKNGVTQQEYEGYVKDLVREKANQYIDTAQN